MSHQPPKLANVSGTLKTVPIGKGATAALVEELDRFQGGDPLVPVTVLTSTVRAAVHLRHASADERRRREEHGGVANVRFLSLALLAKLLAADELALSGKVPLSRVVLAATISSELERRPSRFEPIRTHPSTSEELASTYEDLRPASPEGLTALASTSRRASELVELMLRVRRRLEAHTYDDADLFAAATTALERSQERAYKRVIVYLADRLSSFELGLLEALAAYGEVTAFVSASATSRERLLSVGFVESTTSMITSQAPPARLIEAPDPELEVATAVRLVLHELEKGRRIERLGIFYTHAEPYAPLLASALSRAGVTWSGAAAERLQMTPSARFLDRLLALFEGGLGRAEVMALVLGTRLVDASGRQVQSAEWDRCSRLAGIVAGDGATWRAKLSRLAQKLAWQIESTAERADRPRGSRRDRRAIKACRELSSFVEDLEASLHALGRCESWMQISELLVAVLDHHLGRREEGADWPEHRVNDEEEVRKLLQDLGVLDRCGVPVAISMLRPLLKLGCSGPAAHVGTLGTGLVVGAVEQAHGLDLDVSVVLGCSDEELSRLPGSSVLVSDAEFSALGLDEHTEPARRRQRSQHLESALCCANESVVLYSTGDVGRRAHRVRSPLVRVGGEVERAPGLTETLTKVAAGELVPYGLDELERAALFVHTSAGKPASVHHLARSPRLASALRVAEELSSRRFGGYAGRVGLSGLGEHLAASPFSPTRLEQYATCPFRYFADQLLSIEVIEDPERRLSIDPRDRGSIVHEVLERHVRELLPGGPGHPPSAGDDEVPGAVPGSRERLEQIAEEVFSRYEQLGLTGKRVLWEIERRSLLAAMLEEQQRDDARRRAGRSPIAVEHAFGVGELEPVAVQINGRRLSFRGYIDRVDKDATGTITVVDYKTGRVEPYRGLRSDPVDRGRHLQLPIYALAAKEAFAAPCDRVESSYRFIDEASFEVPFVLSEKANKRFELVLEVLVDGIDAGVFPYRPGEMSFSGHENCRYCDYALLCPSDRALFWESARTEARVASYTSLCEQGGDGSE